MMGMQHQQFVLPMAQNRDGGRTIKRRACGLLAARRCRRRAAVMRLMVLPRRSCSASCAALSGRLPLWDALLAPDGGPLLLPASMPYTL